MSDLKMLLATALVGTSRAALPSHADTALADALSRVKRDDAESTLLARAALVGLATRAGQMPLPLASPPEPAPAELRPEAPARVTRHLIAVLNTAMLPEWLSLCSVAGWRVPHADLPDLLDWGARVNEELRATLRPVLGERGRWLAGFSHDWRWLRGLKSGEVTVDGPEWEAATEAGREALFRALRDADSAASREFLTVHFKSEKAGVRKRLLDVLAQSWEAGDAELEPLLEETLSDRSEDVRVQARRLLQRLPGSAYNARMTGRAKAMLGQEKVGFLGRLRGQVNFTLTLPEVPDADLKRDGLEPVKHPAERLRHLLNAAHPGALMTALELEPAGLVGLAAQFEATDELVRAVFSSAAQPIEPAFSELAELLLPRLKGSFTHWRADLLALVPAQRREAELHAALRGHDSQLTLTLLRGLPTPWPADLSTEVFRQLSRAVRKAESQYAAYDKNSDWDYGWINVLELAQTRAAPAAPRPASLPADAPEYARQTLDNLYAGLDLRAQIHADFAAERSL
ncbi:DUF5691 domain-containing protein [Deinococcus marmoris]|uniref:Uncharacterized protein n=1 Tax=Deinococcus marmoris TaxID=249408 RepID=A0A1U7NR56_9DEIO|nr:DUF5691 domain-containing protein [Deinococcus marmoris]OLV15401.1 hypothetical protein BOO71_0014956 [Deinococcus marmoris]